ncbi:hypothetical protein [Glycomyces paridis]|uniref:Uncharacterized protein n=1 Tax=Glycomyces paridis TaxID=2126555 RepID=A0A4S8PQZ8_9ACTN|nr:hypothetical protein [Glycomyces paridis]THV32052.1 hypothetical protein E9998_00940 [Glycomyces paridis]
MVYDQNRPDEPQRPTGEERPARRRIGRSWGPPADDAPDAAEEARQGAGQPPEQYRFDPDRGRRHRYSEDPTGQVPNVEIAETGPMVPATRRPSPGEQFEPMPAVPQTPQGPQGFQGDPAAQAQSQPQLQSPFAPPGVNQGQSAPPGVNQGQSAPPGANQGQSAPPAVNPGHGAPPGAPQEFGVPGPNREFAAPDQHFSAPPVPNQEYSAPPVPNQDFTPQPPQEFGVQPGMNQSFAPPPAPNRGFNGTPVANQGFQPPVPPQQDFGVPQQHPGYSAPPMPGDYPVPPQGLRQPGPNQEFAPPGRAPEYSPQPVSAPPQADAGPSAPPLNAAAFAPPPVQEPSAPPALRESPQTQAPSAPDRPQHTGPIEIPQPPVQQTPSVPAAPTPQTPVPVAEQQTDQFPIVQQPPVTEFSPAAVPSPPVTEQAPLRTPPANRPPIAEPTPPASVEKSGHLPSPAVPDDPEPERLVDAVRQVPGVRDAFHVTGPDGASSLRLELEEGVDPDEVHQIVSRVVAEQRAVEPGPQSADEPGDEVHARIEAPAAEVEVATLGPIELRRVEIESAGLEAEVCVTLGLGGAESTGKVAVPPIDWHIQHAAAAATVEALRPRLGASDIRVEVEHASIVPTGPVKTAVVVILWLDGQSVRRLSGAAVVTAERSRAVVSATLGALAAEVSH